MIKREIKKTINNILRRTKDFNRMGILMSEKHPDCDLAKLRQDVMRLQQYLELADIKSIKLEGGLLNGFLYRDMVGKYVAIRPCGDEYEGKTYLGVFVGEFPTEFSFSVTKKHFKIKPSMNNPAIFIPSLGKTIMGYQSWWGEIEDENHLRQITDDDINNVWYVQALKQLKE